MNLDNPVETLASAVYSAINNPEILADIEHEWRQKKQLGRPGLYDLKIIHFQQTWGSTAMGFGGIGGAAMTTAYTTVILCRKNAAVFFNGRHCYSVDDFKEPFMKDVDARNMADLATATKKY